MTAKKPASGKRRRSTKGFPTLDDYLAAEGTREKFQATAIKEVLAWQLEQAMKEAGLSRSALAERMHTSRSQLNRILDAKDGNVTLETLMRAARVVGRELRSKLV
jgi:antitoxin HicB